MSPTVGATPQLRLELPVDQDERHHRRLIRAVAPGMVGAALDQDIAGFQHHVLVVEQHGDLARENDRVVDRLGAMHARMAAALAEGRGLLVAERREGPAQLLDAHVADRFGLRREMIDAQHRRVLGRQLAARAERRLAGRRRDRSRRTVGAPDIGRLPAREQGIVMHERRRAVGYDDGAAVLIVSGDHAADRAGHVFSFRYALLAADHQSPFQREQLPAVAVGDQAPQAFRCLQHDHDRDRAQDQEVDRAEVGQRLPQQEEHDGADDRPLDAADAADHGDEDHERGPVVDRECGVRRDADLLQEDERADHARCRTPPRHRLDI